MTKILSNGTPQRIIRDNQSFQLVAIIEGAAANTQFIQNLQLVGQQRRAVDEVAKKVSEAAPADKDALQKQHAQVQESLAKNLEFMVKNYGYSVNHNYLLVPSQAALLLKALDDKGAPIEDESKATLVAEFLTAEAYEELQILRQRALTFAAQPEQQEAFEKLKVELKEKFDFEVGKHYFLQVRKGALYATING